jgi:hypothetical protein
MTYNEAARKIIGENMLKGYQICQTTLKEQYFYGRKEESQICLNYATMEYPIYM